ncbi:MAG TPA: helix-turn-helix domain-containing protein [Mycobacterium sp.]|jgi:AcrR family transcriptional regulator|nr:helix-turn-helix domain-containing protein [Mycobacterium sp.]
MDFTETVIASPGRGAEKRIMAAATDLFYREGIHATGVERIAETARVSKRTLYRYFPTKNDLVEQYLQRIHDSGGIPNEQALDTPGATARNQLLAIFDSRPVDRFRGCPFHDAAVEAADDMPGVHDIVHEHKLWFIARLTDKAAEAGAADPYQLGHQLAVLFEGALALATSLDDTAAMIHARSASEILIDAAVRSA